MSDEPAFDNEAFASPAAASEPAHRVRIGLTGLAVVFLLVLVGTAILRGGDAAPPPKSVAAQGDAPVEPMAEIGAAPALPKSEAKPEAAGEKDSAALTEDVEIDEAP